MATDKAVQESSAPEILLYTVSGALVLGGTFFLGRKLIREAVKKNYENNSMADGSASSYAKSIKMTFDNDGYWGTDVAALRTTMQKIPNKEFFSSVAKSYQKLYNRSVMADMQDELTISQYNEMMAILNAKSDNAKSNNITSSVLYDGWAKRLKASFEKSYAFMPGTDEEAIRAVFLEMQTQQDFSGTIQAYARLYQANLLYDLKHELEFWEYDPMMQLITSKPK
jgi:hypothetical protein